MKKQFVAVAAVAGLALGAAIAQGATSSGGGITGSVHDLSGTGVSLSIYGATADPGQRLCAFCHSPHHSAQNNQILATAIDNLNSGVYDPATGNMIGGTQAQYKIYAPLWSRNLDSLNAGGYGTYKSQTFDPATQGKVYDPLVGPSRLCLTCHDGSIALDSYYNTVGTQGSTPATVTGDSFGGKNGGAGLSSIGIAGGFGFDAINNTQSGGLTNDHPIGMKYTDFLGKTDQNGNAYELNEVTVAFPKSAGGTGNTIKSVLYSDPSDGNVTGFVTCASCHDVHNGSAVGNQPATMKGFLLYGTQVGSKFCLTCHAK